MECSKYDRNGRDSSAPEVVTGFAEEVVVGRFYEEMDAISIHRPADRKIVETWQVWDTLGFLQQLGAVPRADPGTPSGGCDEVRDYLDAA